MGGNSRSYSANPKDYKLLEEIGYGASATVYRAIYLPFNEVVAIKCLDLDRCNSNLDDIRREAQTMSLIDHPNVVMAYCSFVVERNLWVVMPFMAEGSCLHLMKIAYPDGFEEVAIASILKEALKALDYLHRQGHIHRDVKAGNILLHSNGVVKLADFGVSACMFDTGDRQRSRNTFVGTPCWMAPEVLQSGTGYNSKADIWSFGITALELAHGHAPFSKYPPMKVLLMTIQNAPPGLDYDRDKKFSKSFKEMVAMCLVKDQTKRPTAEKLLKHSFFKHAKPPELSVKKLFADLPPLWNRVKALQIKDAAQLALKKMPSAEQEALSQSEYQRGVSAWNFDIEDLKAQASLVQDDDGLSEVREEDEKLKSAANKSDTNNFQSFLGKLNCDIGIPLADCGGQICGEELQKGSSNKIGKVLENENPESGSQGKNSLYKNGQTTEATASTSTSDKEAVFSRTRTHTVKDCQTVSGPERPGAVLSHSSSERKFTTARSETGKQSTEKGKIEVRRTPSFSGPLMLPKRASANSLSAPINSSGGFRDNLDDNSKANLVQIKGRFSVTSENLDLARDFSLGAISRPSSQGSPLRKSASIGNAIFESKQDLDSEKMISSTKECFGLYLLKNEDSTEKQALQAIFEPMSQPPKEFNNSIIPASLLLPHVHNLFQQTSVQQDLIMNLLSSLQPAEALDGTQNGKLPPLPRSSENNGSVETAASEREHALFTKISELQARMSNLTDELTAEKLKFIQLQQQVTSVSDHGKNGDRRDRDA